MVLLHIKRETESQFLYETPISTSIAQLNMDIVMIYNGRLKISRICSEIEELAKYGVMLPPEIRGLNEEQISELKFKDEWTEKVAPSGGFIYNPDLAANRNGQQPQPNMQLILRDAINEAKNMVSKHLVNENKPLTLKEVQEAIGILNGAVTIVYPMKLPPHDRIQMEFINTEDLSGTQASREVIEPTKAQLWFAGRQLLEEKRLHDYLGKNEKCKVILKLVNCGEGAPGREPVFNEAAAKEIMLKQYQRQEELKQLEEDEDDSYLQSKWANSKILKQQLHGVGNIEFRFSK